jgi:lipoprotein-anchoring transpeptidase ErfK/SrfK
VLGAVVVLGSPAAASGGAVSQRSTLIAAARVQRIPVYGSPGKAQPERVFPATTPLGAPRVFLVRAWRGRWLRVLLPARPNGSSGWIRLDSVSLEITDYLVSVDLSEHTLTLTRGGAVVLRVPVGVGSAATPTPTGEFYVTDLVAIPTELQSAYGPYALGLSAFSSTIRWFNGWPAEIAIHGTSASWTIGHNASLGCIRVSNDDIRRLASLLPLGTPVLIVP